MTRKRTLADPNFRDQFNTPLSPAEQADFNAWVEAMKQKQGRDVSRDMEDYDLQGFWKSGQGYADNGHGSDRFKKPNHPSFSDQSEHHGKDGMEGGTWDRGSFQPSETNLKMHPGLEQYFTIFEPETRLKWESKPIPPWMRRSR